MENENPTGETASPEIETADVAVLAAERDQLAVEKAELQDRLLRKLAEFDNFRRRTERELAERGDYAVGEVIQSLLPVLDDFERALQMKSADDEYSRGVELIYQRLFEALKKLGLEPIEAAGKPFDYNVHNAIEMVPSRDAEDHTVLSDLQRGYNFRGRLLRPSMVRVAVKPS
jgi:molecular chaperone GrpE